MNVFNLPCMELEHIRISRKKMLFTKKRLFFFGVLNKYTNMCSNWARETMKQWCRAQKGNTKRMKSTRYGCKSTFHHFFFIMHISVYEFLFFYAIFFLLVAFHMWSVYEVNVFIAEEECFFSTVLKPFNALKLYSC